MLRERGHVNTSYIDDCLLTGETLEDCKQNVMATVKLSEAAGFVVHSEKSVLTLSRAFTYLGFIIDSHLMTVTLTLERAQKIHQRIGTLLTSRRKLSG